MVELNILEKIVEQKKLEVAAMPKRRTYRLAFKPEPVPRALLDVLAQYAERHNCWLHVFEDESARYDVADLISQADRAQWHERQFRRELAAWVTPNCVRFLRSATTSERPDAA